MAAAMCGEYAFDKDASESMEPFLKEVGVPWAIRKLAGTARPDLSFNFDAASNTAVIITSSFRKDEEVLTLDGAERDAKDGGGGDIKKSAVWDESRNAIVTTSIKGADKIVVATLLENERTLVRHIHLEKTNGSALSIDVKRVFRRK